VHEGWSNWETWQVARHVAEAGKAGKENWETSSAYETILQAEGFREDLLNYPPEERADRLKDWVEAWLDTEPLCLKGLADLFIEKGLSAVNWEYVAKKLCEENDDDKRS